MGEKLDRREHLQPLHRVIGNIAAAGRHNAGAVTTYLGRKVWVTLRATFGATADDHLYIEAFYSPDGSKYDTSPLFSTFLPVSAGNVRQITHCYRCVPEVGTVKFEVYNADDVQVDNVEVWAGISKWDTAVTKLRGEKEV